MTDILEDFMDLEDEDIIYFQGTVDGIGQTHANGEHPRLMFQIMPDASCTEGGLDCNCYPNTKEWFEMNRVVWNTELADYGVKWNPDLVF